VLVSVGLTSSAWAAGGTLAGIEKFKVSKCGSFTSGGAIVVSLAFGGNWSANVGGNVYSGSSVGLDNITFTLDANSLALMRAVLADDASALCEGPVTIDAITVTKATLKLNKSQTGAKLRFAAMGTRSAASGTGPAKYTLKAKGAWDRVFTDVPPPD
jgi:hypothetical protein